MKKIVIYSDKRPPATFTGVLLGSSLDVKKIGDDSTIDEALLNGLRSSFEEEKKRHGSLPPGYDLDDLGIYIYKTQSGKIVTQECRVKLGYRNNRECEYFELVDRDYKTYDSMSDFLSASRKKDGSYGRVTAALLNHIAKSDSELHDLWVVDID